MVRAAIRPLCYVTNRNIKEQEKICKTSALSDGLRKTSASVHRHPHDAHTLVTASHVPPHRQSLPPRIVLPPVIGETCCISIQIQKWHLTQLVFPNADQTWKPTFVLLFELVPPMEIKRFSIKKLITIVDQQKRGVLVAIQAEHKEAHTGSTN